MFAPLLNSGFMLSVSKLNETPLKQLSRTIMLSRFIFFTAMFCNFMGR